MNPISIALKQAWQNRVKSKPWTSNSALRVFHGPTEGEADLKYIAIDRFGPHFWLTDWTQGGASSEVLQGAIQWVQSCEGCEEGSIVRVRRDVRESAAEVVPFCDTLWGHAPEPFIVHENGLQFIVRFQSTRHPGLFLDQMPLRTWLRNHLKSSLGNPPEIRALNAFAYTGSLSVAAAKGGADFVLTQDLSGPALAWAGENFELNGFEKAERRSSSKGGFFWKGEFFDDSKKWAKRGEFFDLVVLDPPSFSRFEKGTFSTERDLARLVGAGLGVLKPKGIFVISINSEFKTRKDFEAEILSAVKASGRTVQKTLMEISAPSDSFAGSTHLKGLILQID